VLAVSDFGFRGTENLEELKQIGKELTSTIVTMLSKEQTFYEVVERERINNLLDETWWADTGVVNPDTAARVGEIVGAEAIIVGEVSSLRSWIKANVRLVDLQSAKIRDSWSRQWKITDNPYGHTLKLAGDILKDWRIPSPATAVFKSMLLPGWGQLSNDGKSGYLFLTAEMLAIGGSVLAHLSYQDALNKWEAEKRVTERNRLEEERDDKRNRRNIILGVTAGLWAVNVIESYIEISLLAGSRRQNIRNLMSFQANKDSLYATIVLEF